MDNKTQAALEFLMTYGWAILVVLVAVGALSYFGVFNVDAFLPQKCALAPGIACLDFKANTDSVTLVIKNSIGNDIVVESIALPDYNCETTFFAPLKNGEHGTFNVDCTVTDSKLNSEINLIYEGLDTLRHNASGRITTKVEQSAISQQSGQSDQQVCQNAQDNGLCSGLDLLYGEGYQAACCSEHSLCCQ